MRTFRPLVCRVIVSAVAAWPLAAQIEPGAGAWKTWVLARGGEIRLAPPPGTAETVVRRLPGDFSVSRVTRNRYWTSAVGAGLSYSILR